MIYNLSEYIRVNTGIVPVTNGFDPIATEDELLLIGTGGTNENRGLKVDGTVQVMTRAKSRTEAYRLVQIIYNLLENRFGIILPAVTVDAIVYPAVTVVQILPLQIPGYIGADQNGYHKWSVNFKVTTGGS